MKTRRDPGRQASDALVLGCLGIIVILLGIGASVYPGYAANRRLVDAADRLQGWLLIAKQLARVEGVFLGLEHALHAHAGALIGVDRKRCRGAKSLARSE